MLTKLGRLKGCSARETCVALMSVLAVLLFASAIANAQTSIVVSQQFWGASETNSTATFGSSTVATSGGNWGPASPGGHSAAVNTFGVFVAGTSTGGFVEQFSNRNSAMTVIGESDILPGGIAIDRNNTLYISGESSNIIYKIPVNTTANGSYGVGTYGPINSACPNSSSCAFLGSGAGSTGTPPPACAGIGQSPDINGICQINLGNGNYGFNVASIAVDSQHNLFFTTDGNAGSVTPGAPYSVFECNTACLYPAAGTTPPAPVQIFVEPAGSGGQLYAGAIAIDQNDNVYFTDSFISSSGTTAGISTSSHLYQVPFNSTSKTYAATPTLLATLTPACATPSTGSPCNDAITTVATDAAGNVYFGTESDGVFKIANNGSALAGNPPVIPLSGEGVKTIVPDGNGNFYFVNTNPATQNDTAGFLAVGSVVDTAQAWSGEPLTAGLVSNVSAVDAGAGCSAQSNLTFVENSTDYGFTGNTAASSCTTLPFASGSGFPVTITFTPSAAEAGAYNTTMTATNAADSDTGTFPVSGIAAVAQTITVTSPATLSPNKVNFGVAPIALEATATSGLPVTFATTTPAVCTGVSSGVVTFANNGTCTIQANQAGNSGFAPAPQVVITFTVTALTQKITNLTPISTLFTTTPIPLVATSSNTTSSAAPICFAFVSGAATVSGQGAATGPACFPPQALTLTGTGSIVVAASQAASPGFAAASPLNVVITVKSALQNIVFTTPSGTLATAPSPIVYGSTLTLAATGGASGNPVTYTIDPSSTGAGSISTSGVLTATGLGTLVIDANQAASAAAAPTIPNYAQAAQVQAFLTVVPVSAATIPVISPANGTTLYASGNLNVVTIADTLAGATIYYTTDGSTPTLSSTSYTAPFTLTTPGAATVNAIAIAPGYGLSTIATATYTVSTAAANFTASVAPSTVTVSPSSPGIVDITVTPQFGFNTATTFSCSTVPANLTCSFNPATVTPANGQSASTALTLTVSGNAALQHRSNPFLPEGATFAIAACLLGWKKRRALALTLVLIAGAIGVAQLTGCGSSSSATKATTSSVVVTAASGKVTQTIQLQVTIN